MFVRKMWNARSGLLSLATKSARPITSPLFAPEGRKVQAPLKLSLLKLAARFPHMTMRSGANAVSRCPWLAPPSPPLA